MTISLRLNEADGALIRRYAEIHGLTVSEMVRSLYSNALRTNSICKPIMLQGLLLMLMLRPILWMKWKRSLDCSDIPCRIFQECPKGI